MDERRSERTQPNRYAVFEENKSIKVRGYPTVIDLYKKKLVSNNSKNDYLIEALNFPPASKLSKRLDVH